MAGAGRAGIRLERSDAAEPRALAGVVMVRLVSVAGAMAVVGSGAQAMVEGCLVGLMVVAPRAMVMRVGPTGAVVVATGEVVGAMVVVAALMAMVAGATEAEVVRVARPLSPPE